MDPKSAVNLKAGPVTRYQTGLAVCFALIGARLAWAVAPLFAENPSGGVALLVFVIFFVGALNHPMFRCVPLGLRLLLILLALRPLLDAMQSTEVGSFASTVSLQNAYAMALIALLLALYWRADYSFKFLKSPNIYLVVLLGLTAVAWLHGDVNAGTNNFVRTAWGLLMALLLGPLFRTEKEIDLFVRTIFYSSCFILLVLALNLREGDYIQDVWRLGGQFGVPNTLAAVCFSLFVFGLYTVGKVRSPGGRVLSFVLLAMLALAILFSQSRTVGGLLLISVNIWLWAQGRRRLVCVLVLALAAVFVGSSFSSAWRVTSGLSLEQGALSVAEDVATLTGRIGVWAITLQHYATASLSDQFIGLGWGTVYQNYASMGLEGKSSVTENSFLWFLVGAGLLGLSAFSAYLIWVLVRAWKVWHCASSEFERRLSLLAFIATLTFVVEGFTTDLVLSPVASGYLYAILSIFAFRSLSNQKNPSHAGAIGA